MIKEKKLLIFILFFTFFLIGLFSYKDYGINIEEKFQRISGFYWLNYILSFTSFESLKADALIKFNLTDTFMLPKINDNKFYGVIFDIPAAFIETIFNINSPIKYFQIRHIINYLIFFCSAIYFYKLLDERFLIKEVSLFGFLFYILSPRIYGDSFHNNKDILFLSLITISFYYLFKSFKNDKIKNLIILSLFSAAATSTRIIGLFIPLLYFLFLVFLFIDKKLFKKNFYKFIYFFIFFNIFLILLWPALWSSPYKNLFFFIQNSEKQLIHIKILFNGIYESTKYLPYYYIPLWITISTPIIYIILFFIAFLFLLKRLVLRFINIKKENHLISLWKSNNEKIDLFIFLSLVVNYFFIILFNIPLYSGWRHVYFFNLFIIYLASFGLYLLYINPLLKNHKKIINISIALLISFVSFRMIIYHPYQSLYFNSLLTKSFKNSFSVDFAALSRIDALKYIIENEKKIIIKIGVSSFTPLYRGLDMIDKKNKKIVIVGQSYKDADYIYNTNIYEINPYYENKYKIPKNFNLIKAKIIDEVTIYEIYKRSDLK
jgi:hypothetical protein